MSRFTWRILFYIEFTRQGHDAQAIQKHAEETREEEDEKDGNENKNV